MMSLLGIPQSFHHGGELGFRTDLVRGSLTLCWVRCAGKNMKSIPPANGLSNKEDLVQKEMGRDRYSQYGDIDDLVVVLCWLELEDHVWGC